jgi:hypothetical protein
MFLALPGREANWEGDAITKGLHLLAAAGVDRAPKQAEMDPAEFLGSVVPEAGE